MSYVCSTVNHDELMSMFAPDKGQKAAVTAGWGFVCSDTGMMWTCWSWQIFGIQKQYPGTI